MRTGRARADLPWVGALVGAIVGLQGCARPAAVSGGAVVDRRGTLEGRLVARYRTEDCRTATGGATERPTLWELRQLGDRWIAAEARPGHDRLVLFTHREEGPVGARRVILAARLSGEGDVWRLRIDVPTAGGPGRLALGVAPPSADGVSLAPVSAPVVRCRLAPLSARH